MTKRSRSLPRSFARASPEDDAIASVSFCKGRRRSGFRHPRRFALQLLFLSSLFCVLFQSSSSFSDILVDAFVTPREQQSRSNGNGNGGSSNSNRNRNHGIRLRSDGSPTSATTLHFFSSILTQQNPGGSDGKNQRNGDGDLPLARYVDVSANYTLAHTPEDEIYLKDGQRLVCVGDVHGDLEALKNFLATGGVYDPSTDSWCGGDTVVVQCGDILDRGFEELACYQLLSKLSQEALAYGGKVILLVGNHEAMNAMGLFQYAFTDREHEQFIGRAVDETLGPDNKWRDQYVNNQPSRWASYEPGGLLAHSLLRNMKVAVKVGGTVCVHAGLRPEHLRDHGGIAGMNAAYRDWISLGDDLTSGDAASISPVRYNHHGNYPNPRDAWVDAEARQKYYVNSIPAFLQNGPTGPIWMREYSSPPDAPPAARDAEALLEETLSILGARRLVMGHTIQRRVNGVLGGRAWRVDVGASRGCLGGTPEVLEVRSFVAPDGDPAETVSVLTPGRPGIPARDRLVDAYSQAAVEVF